MWPSLEFPIPLADPADLRRVWMLMHSVERSRDDAAIGFCHELLAEHCSPGADTTAVWFRCAMLEILSRLGALSRWERDGAFDEVVFRSAASIPIARLDLDAAGWIRRIESESAD